jgi:putative ABC transport system permease protein
MALREMRSSWQRLLFFFICIAIGVGAIVALRSVIQSVRNTFAGEARSLIAADAIINSNQPLKPEVVAKIDERLKAAGAQSTRSIELATMARAADRADGRARMVELRAVEEGFPYYGSMKLADDVPYSHALLENFGVLVRPELLAQLDLAVGDRLTIGSQRFTIRGVIQTEPGRRLGAFSIGPRVFVDLADLERPG